MYIRGFMKNGNDMNDINLPKGHVSLAERKAEGAHYTPPELAKFLAGEIFKSWKSTANKKDLVRVLDPAVGDGELLIAICELLEKNGYKNLKVFGFDTDRNAIDFSKKRLSEKFPSINFSFENSNFLEFRAAYKKDDLFANCDDLEFFDIVIANPPYVRTQVMGAKKSQDLASSFGLSGRVDLYYAFIIAMGEVLSPRGKAGVIVSNRFMTIKSGAALRKIISDRLSMCKVWDLGDTQLFEAAVLPAILVFGLKQKRSTEADFISMYQDEKQKNYEEKNTIFDALKESEGTVLVNKKYYSLKKGILDTDGSGGIWRLSSPQSDNWINKVKKNTFCTFEDVGKIRVGIKTTADKVFIKNKGDWDLLGTQKPELLQNLITHHIARRFKGKDSVKKVLYTHTITNGQKKAVDLEKYKNSQTYLESHRGKLESRTYVAKSNRNWFEIWVPQSPDLWAKPKVIFRDISEKPTFWFDNTGSVVNGDCYWICNDKNEDENLLWLIVAVANSTFIEKYYDCCFNNKLYSGRRRFLTQYVKNFPLPDPCSPTSKKMISLAKEIYDDIEKQDQVKKLESQLDMLVWNSFGFSQKNL